MTALNFHIKISSNIRGLLKGTMKEIKKSNSGRNELTRREFLRDTAIVIGGITLSSVAFLNACKSGASSNQPGSSTSYVLTRPHPPFITGDISVGTVVQAVSQSVDTSGGYVAYSNEGNTLDGFVINVPANSYSDGLTFNVSYAPITSHTFGADINPISPMIYVDNGVDFSSQVMYVRVPVTVPDGYFAMGFIYDVQTGQLEGMPLVSTDSDSITIGTCHFSNFFISMILGASLKPDIDSEFRPGVDDWEFTNYGSYITRGGECEGQSLTALWYFCTQPDGNDLCLYGRYDNNGNQPTTPNLWQDDSLGYRLCSVIQTDIGTTENFDSFWDVMNGKTVKLVNNKWALVDVPGLSDETQWNLFAYSIQVTGEPQLVGLFSDAGDGHAMICYRINQGNLYVADPNYPGNTGARYIRQRRVPNL